MLGVWGYLIAAAAEGEFLRGVAPLLTTRLALLWAQRCQQPAATKVAANDGLRRRRSGRHYKRGCLLSPEAPVVLRSAGFFIPRHKYTLRRLILALRAAWGTAVRMEPKAHLGQSYNKQPDVDACNIGRGGKRYSGDVKDDHQLEFFCFA